VVEKVPRFRAGAADCCTKADEAWGLPSSFIRLGKAALHIRIES